MPFGLLTGVAYMQTLILPEGFLNTSELQRVGTLTRREAAALVVGYDFDLRTNELALATIPNPSTGVEHRFEAWRRLKSGANPLLLCEKKGPSMIRFF